MFIHKFNNVWSNLLITILIWCLTFIVDDLEFEVLLC